MSVWADDEDDDNPFDPHEDRRGIRLEIDDIGRLILGYRHRAYEDVSDEIFRQISSYNFGIPLNENSTLMGSVGRKVYNNRDGTYTVLDQFGVRGVVSVGETTEVAGLPLYTVLGAEHGYDFVNIRQYDHKLKIGYAPKVMEPDDPWYVDLWQSARNRWFGIKYFYDFMNGFTNLFVRLFRSPSHEDEPRYTDVLNVVRTPFRLPLSQEAFYGMEPREVMSYTIMGGVFFSVGSGFRQVPFRGNVGLTLFAKGAYRITILKEKEGNHARIKVSKMRSVGYNLSGKIKGDWDVVEGILFGSDLSVSIIPIRISTGQADGNVLDHVYRYDMTTKEGIEAYEKAVFGDFRLSDKYSQTRKMNVVRMYDAETNSFNDVFSTSFNVLMWKSKTSYSLSHAMITMTDKDGVSHVFQSVSKNEIKSGSLFKSKHERLQYYIDTTIELDDPNFPMTSHDPAINIGMYITDRDAYGYELKKYFQIVETILNDPQFFDEGQYKSQRDYGKMSIDFRIQFTLAAIRKILMASEDKMWRSLARAFFVNESEWATEDKRDDWITWQTYVMATVFRRRRSIERIRLKRDAERIVETFKDIRNENNHVKRAKRLTRYHRKTPFQWELLTVMLALAEFEDIYGILNVRGKRVSPKLKEWGEKLEIDRPNLHQDDEQQFAGRPTRVLTPMTDIKISYPEGGRFELTFNTPIDASDSEKGIEGFFFRIHRIRAWWLRNERLFRTPNDADLFKVFEVDNDGRVHVYLDELVKDREFELGKRYEMSFAFRQKNGYWSSEPKLIFVYENKDEMYIQWQEPKPKRKD